MRKSLSNRKFFLFDTSQRVSFLKKHSRVVLSDKMTHWKSWSIVRKTKRIHAIFMTSERWNSASRNYFMHLNRVVRHSLVNLQSSAKKNPTSSIFDSNLTKGGSFLFWTSQTMLVIFRPSNFSISCRVWSKASKSSQAEEFKSLLQWS